MKNKNINNISQFYRNSKVSKEAFIGIIVSLLLDKQLFRTNSDVGEFIKFIFDIELPLYTLRSRTLMLARICKIINDTDDKSLENQIKRTYTFIKKITSESETVTLSHSTDKNNSLTNMNKWIVGILKKDRN